jgi:hypothetical protein
MAVGDIKTTLFPSFWIIQAKNGDRFGPFDSEDSASEMLDRLGDQVAPDAVPLGVKAISVQKQAGRKKGEAASTDGKAPTPAPASTPSAQPKTSPVTAVRT